MVRAIVLYSVVPVREEPKETAAQQTQLLFAQMVTVLEQQPRWLFIRNDEDGQRGWVDRKMLTLLTEEEQTELAKADVQAMVKMPMAYAISRNNGQTLPLCAGTRLPNYKEGQFELLGVVFGIDPQMVAEQPELLTQDNLLQVVRFFLNTPYLWGGKNALGMDCSGFSQIILSIFGRALARNASEQVLQGVAVASLKEAQAGDLAFFDHQDGKISHVGIVIDPTRVVHCSGRVKVEQLDDTGIWSVECGNTYTHHLAGIRRYG